VSQNVDFFSPSFEVNRCGGEKLNSRFESYRPKLKDLAMPDFYPVPYSATQ
jgi:hypothetical protein